ncbi:EF-hand [Panus rudis PR-1116 ss-1]|nr:EF-hand [Panus rudis PR-1116 ss-1]
MDYNSISVWRKEVRDLKESNWRIGSWSDGQPYIAEEIPGSPPPGITVHPSIQRARTIPTGQDAEYNAIPTNCSHKRTRSRGFVPQFEDDDAPDQPVSAGFVGWVTAGAERVNQFGRFMKGLFFGGSQGGNESNLRRRKSARDTASLTSRDITPDGLTKWFASIDVDRSEGISANELAYALCGMNTPPVFDEETARFLMAMFDVNRDGQISITEAIALWEHIQRWEEHFEHFDKNHSRTIDARELKTALDEFGYKLPFHLVEFAIGVALGSSSHRRSHHGTKSADLSFSQFMRIGTMIKIQTETYLSSGVPGEPYEQYIQRMLSMEAMKTSTMN